MPIPLPLRALLRSTPTVAPVPHRALLSITGSQASEFLNGIIASSVADPPRPRYSAFLHAQGRVLHDVFLYTRLDETSGKPGYIVEYDPRPSEAPPLLQMLKRYVLRSKVRIRDATEEYAVWHAWGSDGQSGSCETPRWSWAQSGAVEPAWDSTGAWPWGEIDLSVKDRRAPGMGTRMLARNGDQPLASSHDAAGPEAYDLHRILQGVPEGVVDIPPMRAFPMDSNLDVMGGVDFRKGCYVGQELTVRTYHTGVVRKRILPVVIYEPSESASTPAQAITSALPADSDLVASIVRAPEDSRPTPRPRGTGKLLSNVQGVGLALMRLEQVQGAEEGVLRMHLEGEGGVKYPVSPWRPDWWPEPPAKTELPT